MTGTHGLRVSRDEEHSVATITLDVPEKLNRISMAARDRLREHFEALGRDDSVRAIILRGDGRAFTAGGDIQGLPGRDPGGGLEARLERGRTRAVPETRDRAPARPRLRGRARARPRLRLSDRRRSGGARSARAEPRHDPRQRRHPAPRTPRGARAREGHHHATPAGGHGRGARAGARDGGRPGGRSSTLPRPGSWRSWRRPRRSRSRWRSGC